MNTQTSGSTPLREMLITIIKTKQSSGLSNSDIITGLIHTTCEVLNIDKSNVVHYLTNDGEKDMSIVDLIDEYNEHTIQNQRMIDRMFIRYL